MLQLRPSIAKLINIKKKKKKNLGLADSKDHKCSTTSEPRIPPEGLPANEKQTTSF